MDLTPELVEAMGKAAVGVVAAIGATAATIASAVTAYYTLKNRRDLHIAHDRIRGLSGEKLQYRYDKRRRTVQRQSPDPRDAGEQKGAS